MADAPVVLDVKVIHRRFSDFEILYKELIEQFIDRFIPPIPSKSVEDKIAKDDSAFTLKRMNQL